MIGELKGYGEYKESGLAWLGKVPGHWDMRPAFGAFVPNNENNRGMKEKTVLSLSYGRIIIKPPEKLHGLVPESFETYQIVNPGYIVLRTTDLQNDHTSLRVGMVHNRGIITSAYLALRMMDGVIPDFGFQFLNVWDTSKAIYGYGSGLRQNLDFSHFKRMPVPVPPPAEQSAIVKFLAWSNSRLDRAIKAKRKVITLLTEQKQAIIHRAVTKGLPSTGLRQAQSDSSGQVIPKVKMKDSGIAWLGEVPEHWELRRLKTLVSGIDQGVSPLAVGFLAEGDSWGVLKSGCVNRGVFRETEHKQLAQNFKIDPAIAVKLGDVLISRACGSPTLVGSVGRVHSLKYQLILSDKVFRANFLDHVDVDFMVFAMNCRYYRQQVEQAISGAEGMANNLPLSSLRSFSFVIPPLTEATEIAKYLENSTSGLQTTISRLTHEITLLREYRTRLVADVVTGKLDVREAASKLPDETIPETIEDIDETAEDVVSSDEEIAA
jgi:type I restriction enzyme S subunit